MKVREITAAAMAAPVTGRRWRRGQRGGGEEGKVEEEEEGKCLYMKRKVVKVERWVPLILAVVSGDR